MVFTTLALCLATMLVAWPLLRLELPAVLGQVWASGAGERLSVKALSPLLLIGGVVASAWVLTPSDQEVFKGLPSEDLPSIFAIVLSTLAAVWVSSLVSKGTGVPFAFIGSLLGYRLMAEGALDWPLAARLIASWVAAPLLCALLGALFTVIVSGSQRKRPVHLALSDHRVLLGCIAASLLLVAAAGCNLGQMAALFPSAALGPGPLAAVIAAGSVLLVFALVSREVSADAWHIADEDLDFASGSVLAVLLATGLTLALFSTGLVRHIGMVPTPLSVSALLLAALLGESLARRKAAVEGEKLVKAFVASAVSPILGILVCYSLSMVLGVSPGGSASAGWSARLTPTLIVLGIVAIAAALVLYLRGQRRHALQEQILRSREQQIYNAQKSLSAIEVRAEMNEKDLLNKLEIKRKELVDFAVGVSDQKEYMEGVYDRLSRIRNLSDPAQKDAATDELLSSLRERMYFTREMNDFYAQSEILHKDFNMRLKEAFPDLTESERKLANLLRQGFSSKYIATLMNITPKSVEISRYRLRTKLGLQRSDNLVQFIKSL
jgi:DNA-binding NarL/FixJ family response regulator